MGEPKFFLPYQGCFVTDQGQIGNDLLITKLTGNTVNFIGQSRRKSLYSVGKYCMINIEVIHMVQTGKFRNYENYIIYSDGKIFSTTRNKFLTNKIMQDGYCRLQLWDKCQYKMFNVHRIVAEVFIPNPENKPFVNHKNGNKQDNRVENLEWVTQKENIAHAYKTGLSKIQAKNTGNRCKKIDQYDLNGNHIATFPSIIEINRQYGYSRASISNVCKGKPNYKQAYGYIWKYNETSND